MSWRFTNEGAGPAVHWSKMASSSPKTEGSEPPNLTGLLKQMQRGDQEASDKAVGLVYDELHKIASRELRHERPDHLLQTTALIHEAYARLVGAEALEIQNRGHFFAIASQQMRHILVDHARARDAQRRGGGALSVSLDELKVGFDPRNIDLLLLDESLHELKRFDPRAAKVVELKFFGGYRDHEVTEALGVSFATVRRDWEFARSWLFDRMSGCGDAPRP
jgi:RNA polymerase sigma factor (TIGR02999 family)